MSTLFELVKSEFSIKHIDIVHFAKEEKLSSSDTKNKRVQISKHVLDSTFLHSKIFLSKDSILEQKLFPICTGDDKHCFCRELKVMELYLKVCRMGKFSEIY